MRPLPALLAAALLAGNAQAGPILTGSAVTFGVASNFASIISPSTSAVVADPGSEFATIITNWS